MDSASMDIHERLSIVQDRMASAEIDTLIIGPSEDFQYLIGYTPLVTERLTALVIPKEGMSSLVVPELEAPNFSHLGGKLNVIVWNETESPITHVVDLTRRVGAQRIGVNEQLWSGMLIRIQDRMPGLAYHRGSEILEPLRLIKDQREIELLREASRRIDAVWKEFSTTSTLTGKTELEVAARLKTLMNAHGLSHIAWVDVGSGPNGASPLHHGSDRVIQPGEPVVIDFAGTYNGYFADICRTPVAGEPDPSFTAIYDIVQEAQEEAFRAVKPGTPCQEIDRTARAIISDRGFGENFLHRIGHGLGVSAHEHPYIVEGNETPLEVGMVFSNEPGIYISGRWGVRIEDILVVTPDGAERLNTAPRNLTSMP